MPIIPRLQQLYLSTKTTSTLASNATIAPSVDGYIRSVYDSESWRTILNIDSTFDGLKLAVATDGFNPSSHSSSTYSIWAVVVIIYNLPPSLATKKENILLSLVIPGKYQVENIDVYLRPLINELKTLWSPGVPARDISRQGENTFMLRAVVLWTITDYPSASAISGNYL
jgi:hypothetical protein